MSLTTRLRDHVREHRDGMLTDLAFAVVWVGVVTALFDALAGPQWAYHLSLAAGVVAYFGFVASVQSARKSSQNPR